MQASQGDDTKYFAANGKYFEKEKIATEFAEKEETMQGPGNNPQQPFEPSYNTPIPPPNEAPSMRPMGDPQIRFDVIGEAWNLVKPTLGVWVPAFLIYVVILGALAGVSGALTGSSAQPVPAPGGFPGAPGASYPVAQPNIGLLLIGNLVQFVLGQFLIGGLYRMAINQVKGRTPSIGDMFTVTDVLPQLLVAAILSAIATFLGFLLCFFPGLIVSGLLMFTIPLIVDRRLPAMEALSTSWNALKGQWLMAFLFLFVIGIVASIGVLLCGVGVLVTGPIAIMAMALLYRDFFLGNETRATFDNYSGPSAPIPPPTF